MCSLDLWLSSRAQIKDYEWGIRATSFVELYDRFMTEHRNPPQAGNYSEISTECQQALLELTNLLSYIASSENPTPDSDRYLRLELAKIQRRLSYAESLIFSDYNRPVFF